MIVQTYNDPVKTLARKELRDFISSSYSHSKLRDLRVLCFPGAEVVGEEAIEVKEVYDALGIRRENIIGLEADRTKAQRLRDANLGIRVENCYDWEFFQRTDETFDVISLDYTSNFGDLQSYSIDLISGRHLLGNRGVLATNYYGAREQKYQSMQLKTFKAMENIGLNAHEFVLSGNESYLRGSLEKLEGEIERTKLRESRSLSIQNMIFESLTFGEASINPFILEKINPDLYKETKVGLLKVAEKFDFFMGRNLEERLARLGFHRAGINAVFIEEIYKRFPKGSAFISNHLFFSILRPYFLTNHKAFSYVSNKNSPMLMDLWFVDQFKERLRDDLFKLTVEKDGTKIDLLPDCSPKKRAKKMQKTMEFLEEAIYYLKFKGIERTFLGSYSNNNGNEKSVSRGGSGNDREIPTSVDGDGKKSLPEVDENERDPCCDNDFRVHNYSLSESGLETITKEEAIELLSEGISIKEISEVYSGFSKRQLAALKAHITMGSYS